MLRAPNGCAGVDLGDGFDCYGVPVNPNDPRTRRLTGVEIADVWQRLRRTTPQQYTLEELAHIRAGTFGEEGLALWRTQTPNAGAQPLPGVTIVGESWGGYLWPLLGLAAVIWWATRPHKRGG